MQHIRGLVQHRAVYLWVIFVIPALATFGHYMAPNQPVFKGHDYGILIAFALTLLAAVLWIPYRSPGSWPRIVFVFLALIAFTWTYQVVRIQLDDSLFNLTAFLVPLTLILLGMKRVTSTDVWLGITFMGYSLLAVAIASFVFGGLGVLPNGFDVSDGGGGRLQFLVDIGLTRWGGPFGSVNYAAPVGGLLIVLGIALVRSRGLPLLVGGIAILFMSQGLTALFATIAAVAVQILWSARLASLNHLFAVRLAALASLAVVAVAYVAVFNPTLSYRTELWADFSVLVDDSPLVGIGDSGVRSHVAQQAETQGGFLHDHAHSVLFDSYIRFGMIILLLGILVYAIALVVALRASRSVGSGPLALVVFVIAAGLTETTYSWSYWTIYMAALVWAVLLSSNAEPDEPVAQGSEIQIASSDVHG